MDSLDLPLPLVLPVHLAVAEPAASRAFYALSVLLRPLGVLPVRDVDPADEPGLVYGNDGPDGWHRLPAGSGLLDEPVHVDFDGEAWPVLFADPASGRPDIVMSAFFWLSGWQERLIIERDANGRFPFHASFQQRFAIATKPVVDAYRCLLEHELIRAGLIRPRERWHSHPYVFCATHDIDYGRKWRKGIFFREFVQMPLGGLQTGEKLRRGARNLRQILRREDPFVESLELLSAEHERGSSTATFFVKAGAHGPYDVPYALDRQPITGYLRRWIEAGHEIGLHPSYFAHAHEGYLKEELMTLRRATGERVTSVRQHYLRYDPTVTPLLHQRAGFRVDSSLAFAEHEGFRNGTCFPFRLYDWTSERASDIVEVPLSVMDATLFFRRGFDADQAVHATLEVLRQVRRFGGVANVLWHNVLADEIDFPGWNEHFRRVMERARADGAAMLSVGEAAQFYAPIGL
jgi:peptidoglycan/xylan/chitin deacetylase (PgdA/CDA1 family)